MPHGIKEMKDGRIILSGMAYQRMKAELRKLADNHCEVCGKYDTQGDVDHLPGRGGGKRDDRIFVAGKRVLKYTCRVCHDGRHIPAKVVPPKQRLNDEEFRAMLGLSAEDCQ
jgi:hypothetical protein